MSLLARLRQPAITFGCYLLRPFFHTWRREPDAGPDPRHILVLRRCCLGDVLMTTPLLATLDTAYPDARITYAAGKWAATALERNPHVDAVLRLPEHPTWRDWVRIVGKVRRGGYDLALVADRSPLPALATALAGIPRRAGFDSAGRGFALTARVALRGVRHETDLALDLARLLGLPDPARRPHYRPSDEARERVGQLLAARQIAQPLFVIHPGGGANPGVTMDTKRWLPERFARVADGLVAQYGGTIALVGAASDQAAVNATRAAMRTEAIDFAGALSVAELGALCERATLYIGNDAGTTHLAEACGAPVVVVFGPTDPAQYGPTDGIGEAVWDPIACGPHIQRGDLTRPGSASSAVRCIDAITVEQVLDAAARVLARADRLPRRVLP